MLFIWTFPPAVTSFFFEIDVSFTVFFYSIWYFPYQKSDNDELQPLIDHLAYIKKSKDSISMKNEGFGVS